MNTQLIIIGLLVAALVVVTCWGLLIDSARQRAVEALTAAEDEAQSQRQTGEREAAHNAKHIKRIAELRGFIDKMDSDNLDRKLRHEAEIAKLEERHKADCATLQECGVRITHLAGKNAELRAQRNKPVRIQWDDAMPEEQVTQTLAGTAGTATIKAVRSLVGSRMVVRLDASATPPGERYDAETRLHDAGGASALADLLRDLDSLTAAQKEEPQAAA